MSPSLILFIIAAYFLVLIGISFLTSKNSDNQSFFLAGRKSPWYIVAFGMIGVSLSGVTFISVPGWVAGSQFGYMQMVLGYIIGYAIISFVLMPMYYKLNVTSIYSYLGTRFGKFSHKTGAAFFLLSRLMGASLRLYLVAIVLDTFVLSSFGVPFWATVAMSIALIWLYTFKGGIKTIIWTDTLQTLFMLLAVGVSIYEITTQLNLNFSELISTISESNYSQVFFFDDYKKGDYFWKMFFGGAVVALAMTGLDQDIMQKNLTCKNTKDAQKNMMSLSVVLVFVNLLFLCLGALLYIYADKIGISIPTSTDKLYPTIALQSGLSLTLGVFFILGLIAAAYSSADSALTALTTSVFVDFLNTDTLPEEKKIKLRKLVHIAMSVAVFLFIILFKAANIDTVISALFKYAGYTYGPLLGLFFYGLISKRKVWDMGVPLACIIAPILCYILDSNSAAWFSNYKFGYELLLINGIFTFVFMHVLSYVLPSKPATI